MKELYLIDVPPPTISGELHMGHVLSYVQMDFMARHHRRSGKLVYPFCFDNNGLPTERLGQAAGIQDPEAIRLFSETRADDYRRVFDAIGMAFCGPSYSTYSGVAEKLCIASFEDLLSKDLVYKAEAEHWWCPKFRTSISQSELTEDGRYERSGEKAILKKGEGYFVRTLDHLDDIRDAVNTIEWHPGYFKTRLLDWLGRMDRDWSISRERNFGIAIPGESRSVFDTWFISSLSPQLAFGNGTLECPVFDARFQSHDIIRTWTLFTIVKSLFHNGQIPWRHIVISGHALDSKGEKLSKSNGKSKPISYFLDQYGQSGLRYWASKNNPGSDTRVDEQTMLMGKRLLNKIRNARRFIGMQDSSGWNDDFWAMWTEQRSRFDADMAAFEWSSAIGNLTRFFWNEMCDKWIELSKREPLTDTLKVVMTEVEERFAVFMPDVLSEPPLR